MQLSFERVPITFGIYNTVNDYFTKATYSFGSGSYMLEIFSTYNCQLSVLAGIQNFIYQSMGNIEKNESSSFSYIIELLKGVAKYTEKPLIMVDLTIERAETVKKAIHFFDRFGGKILEKSFEQVLLLDNVFKSTNGHTREIMIINTQYI